MIVIEPGEDLCVADLAEAQHKNRILVRMDNQAVVHIVAGGMVATQIEDVFRRVDQQQVQTLFPHHFLAFF